MSNLTLLAKILRLKDLKITAFSFKQRDTKLQAIGDAGIGGRPGDFLLHEPMGRTDDLLRRHTRRTLRPRIATSSQDRASWACRTIGPRRSHFGQRQPFLKGLTQRWSSVSRCLNAKAVIFRSFRRSIFASNVKLLMGFLSLSISGQQLRGDPCLPSIASPRMPQAGSGPTQRLSILVRLRRYALVRLLSTPLRPPDLPIIKSIPWGKSDRPSKRLRTALGLRCRQVRRFRATTNSAHDLPVGPQSSRATFYYKASQRGLGDRSHIPCHR